MNEDELPDLPAYDSSAGESSIGSVRDIASDNPAALFRQIQNRLVQLAGQIEAIHSQVDTLAARLEQDGDQVGALVQHLTTTQLTHALQQQFAEFTEQMNAQYDQLTIVAGKLNDLATQEQLVRLATVVASQEQLLELAESVQEMGRNQFKANALGETREQQLESALATLQEIVLRREQIRDQQAAREQQRSEEFRRNARGELAADLLPALDGLELVLDRGKAMAARHRHDLNLWLQGIHSGQGDVRGGERSASPGGLFQKFQHRLAGEQEGAPGGASPSTVPESVVNAPETIEVWLRTLSLVRERFLALLANEGVTPIPTARALFDPRLHVAVKAEPRSDVAPNTILHEVRRGYRQDRRVLRYAEVVIAAAPEEGFTESSADD